MGINTEWLEMIPGQDLQGAISILNSFDWNISKEKFNENWRLFSGDRLLFSSDNETEVDAFIFGMALSFAVLPNEIQDKIRQIID